MAGLLGVEPAVNGPLDLRQAADRSGILPQDLWRLWRTRFGPDYPETPWPEGYDSLDDIEEHVGWLAGEAARTVKQLEGAVRDLIVFRAKLARKSKQT